MLLFHLELRIELQFKTNDKIYGDGWTPDDENETAIMTLSSLIDRLFEDRNLQGTTLVLRQAIALISDVSEERKSLFSPLYFNLGFVLEKQEKFTEAINWYKLYLQENPSDKNNIEKKITELEQKIAERNVQKQ